MRAVALAPDESHDTPDDAVPRDREYERLGGTETIKANVRFVAATHRDLDAMIQAGSFREDLFYRLTVVTLWSPPLRERRDDIRDLARLGR